MGVCNLRAVGQNSSLLEIEVYEIRGRCPVYKVGDKIVIDGPEIVLEETEPICVHALSTLLHYVAAREEGANPVRLGLTKSEDEAVAYMQCVDPGQPYTEGGTAVFKCRKVERERLST